MNSTFLTVKVWTWRNLWRLMKCVPLIKWVSKYSWQLKSQALKTIFSGDLFDLNEKEFSVKKMFSIEKFSRKKRENLFQNFYLVHLIFMRHNLWNLAQVKVCEVLFPTFFPLCSLKISVFLKKFIRISFFRSNIFCRKSEVINCFLRLCSSFQKRFFFLFE